MTLRARYPIVIVGAGPTGLTLANLLGVYGIEALVLERNPATVQEPRGVSIDDESLRTMQNAKLADAVLSETVAGYGVHYHSAAGDCFAKVEPSEEPFGYPRRNAFRQPVLEQQLRDGLARFPHVEALFRHEMTSFKQTADEVVLQVKTPDGAREIACDYLVACDGASSAVRQSLGIELTGSSFRERWLIVDLENSPVTSKHTKAFCDPQRPAIALPGPKLTRRYEFMLHEHERDEDLLRPDVVQQLLDTHEAAPQSRIVRTAVYAFHARFAERWSAGRILLGGDAAHLMPPFAGQGMNSGLRDANNLAWKLAAVVRGTLGRRVLDSYEMERRDHVAAMINLSLNTGRVMAPRNALSAWLTQNAFRMLAFFPKARDYIAQMRFKPAPRFREGFLLADGYAARQTVVGRLFPQPRVESNGALVLLDELLGDGFAFIIRSPRGGQIRAILQGAPWNRLNARSVVLPVEGPQAGIPEPFAGRRDHVFLLRPDRYVAACIPADDLAAGGARLAALIDATFKS